MKQVFALLSLLLCTLAAPVSADTYFLLVDPQDDRVVHQVGDAAGLRERLSPCSSFKIALSLMGYDAGILIDDETPCWPYVEDGEQRDVCRHALTPRSWMANSCIWYSQVLTRQLGMERFSAYVDAFEYGNRDLTGDPGRANGLTDAWLCSSLKISVEEQVAFLKKMLWGQLPISAQARAQTLDLLFTDTLNDGWSMYGKTGMGWQKMADGTPDPERYFGWFVGWIEKGDRQLLFALNLRNITHVPPPAERRQLVKELLKTLEADAYQ